MPVVSKAAYISLLWPDGHKPATDRHWQSTSAADLGLDLVVNALNIDGKHGAALKSILLGLNDDLEIIRYRQEIIDDLRRVPALLAQLEGLLPLLSDLTYYSGTIPMQGLPFQKIVARLGELDLYVQAVTTLHTYLNEAGTGITSRGLLALRELVRARIHDTDFERLQQELPKIGSKIRDLKSITIGVNLDHDLKPFAATLLSINTEAFKGSGLFKKLFGEHADFQGIAQLHSAPKNTMSGSDGRRIAAKEADDPLLFPLFKDIDGIISDIMRPMEQSLRNFLRLGSQFLTVLEPEIVFYIGALRLIRDMEARGLPMCRPKIAAMAARLCLIHDCYNLHLALRTMHRQPEARLGDSIVGNDVQFDDEGRIFIITGPNQGGKTTFVQAVALAQVLFQAGLYVPGSTAEISPVDGIYSHFPVEEKPNTEAGRFGEEALRLNEIFKRATRHSLILLNETLSSTAAGEGLYLARDIVRCLRLLGVRAAYTTHMHDLAASAAEINGDSAGDSKVLSLVAVAQPDQLATGGGVKRTYKFMVSPPLGHSYAQELAVRYGISYDKLVEMLAARQVIPAKPADGTNQN